MDNFDLKKYLKINLLLEEETIKGLPSKYKLVDKEVSKNEYRENSFYTVYTYYLGKKDYTSPNGLNFTMKGYGQIMVNDDEIVDFTTAKGVVFYFIYMDVSLKDKKIHTVYPAKNVYYTESNLKNLINKTEKWINQHSEKIKTGETNFHDPSEDT